MEEYYKQKKVNKKVNEIKTFPIPFDLNQVWEDISDASNSLTKEEIIHKASRFHSEGNTSEAAKYYRYFIDQGFNDHRVFSNYGALLKSLGNLQEAELSLRKAIELNPNFADAYYNLGNTLKDLGHLQEAELSLRKAIELNSNFAMAYSNLGNVLKDLGNLQEAELSLRKAIELNPNFAMAYSNLGSVLKDLGNLQEAQLLLRKAIELNPHYAMAYSNLGIVLRDLGNLQEAELLTLRAIELQPKFADAAWNLYGLSNNVQEAEERIYHYLKINKNNLNAYISLSALKLHQGDPLLFYELMESKHKNHAWMRSIQWVSTLPKLPKIFFNRWCFFDNAIKESKQDRPFYEFGVWHAMSFKYLMNSLKKGYGFDTFVGLPEDWHNVKQGTYSAEGIIPQINGGTFVAGKFEDTLPTFFAEPRPVASIINFDADLYSSTLCALKHSNAIIDKHTILIFDEFITNNNWEQDEYKALNEFCRNNNYTYEVIAISYITKQVAVKLLGF